jgi:uncharacterized metal-binding protein YceD (DUF177 family)
MTDTPPVTRVPDLPLSHPFRVATLAARKPTRFDLTPNAAARALVAATLGLSDLPKLSFRGELRPAGKRDYILEAELVARVVQPCGISLVPVITAIREPVLRRYLAEFTVPEGDEAEMPDDDTAEPLPEVIDIGAVVVEALALALPLYPRAPGVELGEAVFAEPGAVPLRAEDIKPFAGLAALKAKLEAPGNGSE